MRKLIAIAAVLLLAGAALLMMSGAFSPEARRDRLLRQLNDRGVVVRRSCGLGEAHVDGALWRDMTADAREKAAAAIAGWCAEHGGENRLTILDSNTHGVVARWNGSSLEVPR
jgi:hypothetical protein